MITDGTDMMQSGLNLGPHNSVSFEGCLNNNEFLNSQSRSVSVHLKLVLQNLKIPVFDLFSVENGSFAFYLCLLMELTRCSPGHNLSSHNFVSIAITITIPAVTHPLRLYSPMGNK